MTAPIGVRRLHSSGLAGPPLVSPEQVVLRLGAVQAQDWPAARWAVAQRTAGATAADIDSLLGSGALLRTHVLRPTWHLVLPEDIRWMLDLCAARIVAAMAPYQRGLGIDAAVVERSNAALGAALQGGVTLTRSEVREVLLRNGISPDGMRTAHLLMRAELAGVVCSGGLRGRQQTYALLDDRAPPSAAQPRDAALAVLATRYFAGHGPALLHDFAWWAGLTIGDARAGIETAGAALKRHTDDDRVLFSAGPPPRSPQRQPLVHLLPNFDEHLVGYRDRSWHVDAGLRERIPGSALLGSSVVLDGQVIGAWRGAVRGSAASVTTHLHRALDQAQRDALRIAVDRYGRFLGMPAELVEG